VLRARQHFLVHMTQRFFRELRAFDQFPQTPKPFSLDCSIHQLSIANHECENCGVLFLVLQGRSNLQWVGGGAACDGGACYLIK